MTPDLEISFEHGLLSRVTDKLCLEESYSSVYHRTNHDVPMPSRERLGRAVELLRSVLFPGYYDHSHLNIETMKYYTGSTLDEIAHILAVEIKRGFCFACAEELSISCTDCNTQAVSITRDFIDRLPEIRKLLAQDVIAAWEGDPAAKTPGEAIFCYPSIHAMTNHRIAHELYKLDVPLIPRLISELAHSKTGIDIHPGATIGPRFFMDHGTGIVIGETSVIGTGVRIYQGVTLGARSFPLDAEGNPIKGILRHPVVENNVIIYSGATILGRVTIGENAVIGGNVWITRDVKKDEKVLQAQPSHRGFMDGDGI
ncbi:MAG: serine acetyltransferase [Deltaproteobacteria bacterium]|nr:serine acetyltransferase [Deltaproteobacteria bacterium]